MPPPFSPLPPADPGAAPGRLQQHLPRGGGGQRPGLTRLSRLLPLAGPESRHRPGRSVPPRLREPAKAPPACAAGPGAAPPATPPEAPQPGRATTGRRAADAGAPHRGRDGPEGASGPRQCAGRGRKAPQTPSPRPQSGCPAAVAAPSPGSARPRPASPRSPRPGRNRRRAPAARETPSSAGTCPCPCRPGLARAQPPGQEGGSGTGRGLRKGPELEARPPVRGKRLPPVTGQQGSARRRRRDAERPPLPTHTPPPPSGWYRPPARGRLFLLTVTGRRGAASGSARAGAAGRPLPLPRSLAAAGAVEAKGRAFGWAAGCPWQQLSA